MQISAEAAVVQVPFAPLGTSPLRRGFVDRLPERGGRVLARERYVVEGAVPDGELEVRLLVHLFDPTCSNRPLTFASTPLRTDASGDGAAELVVRAEDVPTTVRRTRHGVRWEIRGGGTVLYRTDCASLAID